MLLPDQPADHPACLAARIESVPRSAPSDGLSGLDRHAGLRSVFDRYPRAQQLVEALREHSPYLWDLAVSRPDRLAALLDANPDVRIGAILDAARTQIAAEEEIAAVMRVLRHMKSEAALLIALADIGGVWPVTQVTRALTELADTAVSGAVAFLFADAARRGRTVSAVPSGYIVLAMGKMGAFELNYSSDIDLIVFYDPERVPVPSGVEPAPFMVRLTRSLIKLLQERTVDGYVFRTDLRLRPDPASTQVAISTPAGLNYYESAGQNWERAAMIKARPCAGDIAAGEDFLRSLTPFIWRKYLDFAAVADVHAMKRQIHAYRGHSEIAVEGHNVKLGRGGIREIEFFAQTQQLIAGGRNPDLRGRETLTTLEALAQGQWIAEPARDDLSQAYRFLRQVEHRLQMVADEQTHTLPESRDGLETFARFLGFDARDSFADVFTGHLRRVQSHYAALFETAPAREARERALSFPADADDPATLDKLSEMGFRAPLEISVTVRHWHSAEYRALRGAAAREIFAELVPLFIDQFARSDNPDAALKAFDHFLSNLHGAARFFSLLRQNADLIALLAQILGMAPRLADILARHPEVMDAVIDPRFFGSLPDERELSGLLEHTLQQASSYEDFLDRVRMFSQEHMFLTGTRVLSGTVSAERAGESFARLAEVLVRSLERAVSETFAQTHGRLDGQKSAVLAMGKLGSREMTATSDLDLIFVYDFEGETSDGDRPLYGSQYFARLVQRLISALTAQTNYGVLYAVDMRLRPSGRAGPLATRFESFAIYQESEAWTWEHMALTRARVLTATPGFKEEIEAVIRTVLCRERDAGLVAADVVDMRRAIAEEKGAAGLWDLKHVPGGLIDIEFVAQYLQLAHAAAHPGILDPSTSRALDKAWRLGVLATEDAEILRSAVRLYHNLTQILRLSVPDEFDPKNARRSLLALLARAADVPDVTTLEAFVADTQERVRKSFARVLGASP